MDCARRRSICLLQPWRPRIRKYLRARRSSVGEWRGAWREQDAKKRATSSGDKLGTRPAEAPALSRGWSRPQGKRTSNRRRGLLHSLHLCSSARRFSAQLRGTLHFAYFGGRTSPFPTVKNRNDNETCACIVCRAVRAWTGVWGNPALLSSTAIQQQQGGHASRPQCGWARIAPLQCGMGQPLFRGLAAPLPRCGVGPPHFCLVLSTPAQSQVMRPHPIACQPHTVC